MGEGRRVEGCEGPKRRKRRESGEVGRWEGGKVGVLYWIYPTRAF